MIITAPMAKDIAALNVILGSELGRTPEGMPLYSWQYSENIMHAMRKLRDDGTPTYEYHANPDSGLIEVRPEYVLRKMCLSLDQQWVLCKWQEPISEHRWREMFGYHLEWPRHGEYAPIGGPVRGYAALRNGERPTTEVTYEAIWMIKQDRAKKQRDWDNAFMEADRKKEATKRANIRDDINNDLPTYNQIPGKKNHVSFPPVNLKN